MVMRIATFTAVLGTTLLLGACGPGESDPGPGGVTVGEAKALDQAAAMIEARRLPSEAVASPTPQSSDTAPPPKSDN